MLGIAGRDGCFADRFCLPIVNLVAVPEVWTTITRCLPSRWRQRCTQHQLHFEGKPYITVLGDGRLGLLCVQVMSQANASVRLIGKHEEDRDVREVGHQAPAASS